MDSSSTRPTPLHEIEEQVNRAIEGESETVEVELEPSKKKAKSLTSDCWKFFTKVGVGKDGKERARCNACKQEYVIGGKKYGTSHLNRHIQKCKEIKFEDIGQMMIDMQGKLKSIKIDQMVSRELCANLIIKHDLPFSFVEYDELWDWLKYLNPDVVPISRNTAKSDVVKIFNREKTKLKEEMSLIPGRICLTSDLWTSCKNEGFITLTAHFVDTNWRLQSKILNFCHMPPPHTGFELYKKVNDMMVEWGIEKKVFSITLDNASSNDVMVHTLKSHLVLQKWLLCDGEFFHVRCLAHILNLIVQEGLKVSADALHKIRESIKHVRASEGRMIKFKSCMKKVGVIDASSSVCLDVPTRWNSTYLMLKSAIKYQLVFSNLHLVDDTYIFGPSTEEWKRAEKMCRFLEPFYDITTLISGSSYPTSNLYFLQVWKIQFLLKEIMNDEDEDEVLKNMGERMMVKFDKYWDEYSVVLALGAVLDPRCKLESLGFLYEKLYPSTWEGKVEHIKTKLYMLFSHYSSASSTSTFDITPTTTRTLSSLSGMSSKEDTLSINSTLFGELRERKVQAATKIGRSQLDVYLEDPTLDIDLIEEFDVLQWWRNHRHRFTNLSLLARDLLSIPITTVASESAFSIGSRILNKYRSRLLSTNVEAIICARNWLCGYRDDGDEEDDDKNKGSLAPRPPPPPPFPTTASASNVASNAIDLEDD